MPSGQPARCQRYQKPSFARLDGSKTRSHMIQEDGRDARPTLSGNYCALKAWSTVLLSLAASVTFWVCSPSFSCTNAIV